MGSSSLGVPRDSFFRRRHAPAASCLMAPTSLQIHHPVGLRHRPARPTEGTKDYPGAQLITSSGATTAGQQHIDSNRSWKPGSATSRRRSASLRTDLRAEGPSLLQPGPALFQTARSFQQDQPQHSCCCRDPATEQMRPRPPALPDSAWQPFLELDAQVVMEAQLRNFQHESGRCRYYLPLGPATPQTPAHNRTPDRRARRKEFHGWLGAPGGAAVLVSRAGVGLAAEAGGVGDAGRRGAFLIPCAWRRARPLERADGMISASAGTLLPFRGTRATATGNGRQIQTQQDGDSLLEPFGKPGGPSDPPEFTRPGRADDLRMNREGAFS